MASRLTDLGRHFVPSKELKAPIKVTVTGGAGNIGYAICFMIAQGRLLGPNQPIDLVILEIPPAKEQLEGTLMELRDGAFPLLNSISGYTDYENGFKGCQVAILIGAKPRGKGMERKDLLGQNGLIFKGQGQAINKFAHRNCKVVVVGNPVNTNAMICSHFAPDIPRENFTALTRLDQNRAMYQVADKIGTQVTNIKNLPIWGNHSLTQYPDVNHGTVLNYPQPGFSTSLKGALSETGDYATTNYISKVAKRGAEVIQWRKLSSAASAASAACDHVHDWLVGTLPGEFVSMAVMSDGSYGIPKEICFSYPVTCKDGKWTIVKGLPHNEFSNKKLKETTEELLQERKQAFEYMDSQK